MPRTIEPFPTFSPLLPEVSEKSVIRLLEQAFPKAFLTWDAKNHPDQIICSILRNQDDQYRILVKTGKNKSKPVAFMTAEREVLSAGWVEIGGIVAVSWDDLLGWVSAIREDIGDVVWDKFDWSGFPQGIATLKSLCQLCWELGETQEVGPFKNVWLNGAKFSPVASEELWIVLTRPGDLEQPTARILKASTGEPLGIGDIDLIPEQIERAAQLQLTYTNRIKRDLRRIGSKLTTIQVSPDVYLELEKENERDGPFVHVGSPWAGAASISFFGISLMQDSSLPAGSLVYSTY